MRKKPTFEELANCTLAKPQLPPASLPYIPPNDGAAAVMEHLRATMETLQRNEVNGERIQAESATAAREAGLPRDYFENLARGIVTEFGQMHGQLSQQHRDATAASANHATQQTERLLAEHAAALQEMKRNKEMQDAIAASLQNAPGLTAQSS